MALFYERFFTESLATINGLIEILSLIPVFSVSEHRSI